MAAASQRIQVEATVLNKLGLHARPASEFVKRARAFKSTIQILKGGETYSASSILDILSANLDFGSAFIIEAEGPDAEEALGKLTELLREFPNQED